MQVELTRDELSWIIQSLTTQVGTCERFRDEFNGVMYKYSVPTIRDRMSGIRDKVDNKIDEVATELNALQKRLLRIMENTNEG